MLDLSFCLRAFSSCGEQELPLVAVCGRLTAGPSLAVGHRLWAHGLQWSHLPGSGAQAQELRPMGSAACGVFLEQGLNLCPLHWPADS